MFDLKVINSVLDQLEDERGIPKQKILEAIEAALATAYKKEYGKRGQIVRAHFNQETGTAEFEQVKVVVDETRVKMPREEDEEDDTPEEEAGKSTDDLTTDEFGEDTEPDDRVTFNPEHHILIADAQRIKKDVALDDELVFPLEGQAEYGRIAAQTAKQVIIQKIREAEKDATLEAFAGREGEIVTGAVQRIERGTLYVELDRAVAILPYEEQIPGERYRAGDRIRAYLYSVEESSRGVSLRLSRAHPQFLFRLFEIETPEISTGTVEIKHIAREPGSRSKIAVHSTDAHIDPVGSLVGQRGVRVSTVMSELGGEKIDIIEWSVDPAKFIEDALSPAKVLGVEINESEQRAIVEVLPDQQSLAIGKGGQNVRLAAKLTGWKIDIHSHQGDELASADENGGENGSEAEVLNEKTDAYKDENDTTVDTESAEEKADVKTEKKADA